MILSCNSCGKKFIVPDSAIGPSGRLVQCSSCGNKWKQLPISTKIKKERKIAVSKLPTNIEKKTPKLKKKRSKKRTGPDLYSPEYLSKKHGITLSNNDKVKEKNLKPKIKQGFGFYNYLILLIVGIIFLLKVLHFNKNIIYFYFPFLEIYIEYLFESIFNIFEVPLVAENL